MMNDEKEIRFTPVKCPNCNGYGTVSYGKFICVPCGGKGIIIIDQKTGLQVKKDDDENKDNSY